MSGIIACKRVKLKNRRVMMGRNNIGEYCLFFKILDSAQERKDRVRETKLKVSAEAMDAIIELYFVERGAM